MHAIEHPPEPNELFLAWQAPASVKDRLRWAVGRVRKVGQGSAFNYLEGAEFETANLGRSFEELRAAGYSGYPAFDPRERPEGGHWDHALAVFLRRVPSATRSDFPDYLAHHHLKWPTPLSPFALLGLTEARLPSDGFSLVDPLDPLASCVDLVFEIAGFSHYAQQGMQVEPGEPLELQPEPSNPKDRHAVQVKAAGVVIGYVNRLQAGTIRKWLEQRRLACCVARLNGPPDSPRAYAFLEVRPAESHVAA